MPAERSPRKQRIIRLSEPVDRAVRAAVEFDETNFTEWARRLFIAELRKRGLVPSDQAEVRT
jgi:hypothetical protein